MTQIANATQAAPAAAAPGLVALRQMRPDEGGRPVGGPDAMPERVYADPREPGYADKNKALVSTVLENVSNFGKRNGRPQSARFVDVYRTNKNPAAVVTVSAQWLFSLPATSTNGAGRNLARFENQIRDAAASLRPGQSVRITDHWDAQILSKNYPHDTDHYTALGSFTIQSSASIVVSKDLNGNVSLGNSSVRHQLIDRYDWNNPVTIRDWDSNRKIELTARNFQDYERAGGATPFDVRSEPALSKPTLQRNGQITWTTTDTKGRVLTPSPGNGQGGSGFGLQG
jgi:hypothetical protein